MKTLSHRMWKMALWVFGLAAVLLLAAFVLISMQIGADVRATSRNAVAEHGGDPIEALTQYVQDSRHSLRERNRAVWALGQLGEPRALAALRPYYSGASCDHANALCQRELRHAIQLLDGGFNATAFVWRR